MGNCALFVTRADGSSVSIAIIRVSVCESVRTITQKTNDPKVFKLGTGMILGYPILSNPSLFVTQRK